MIENNISENILEALKSVEVFYECKDYVIVKNLDIENDYKIITDQEENSKIEHFPTIKNISKQEAEIFINDNNKAISFLKQKI